MKKLTVLAWLGFFLVAWAEGSMRIRLPTDPFIKRFL